MSLYSSEKIEATVNWDAGSVDHMRLLNSAEDEAKPESPNALVQPSSVMEYCPPEAFSHFFPQRGKLTHKRATS
jgi:hypothetical protein